MITVSILFAVRFLVFTLSRRTDHLIFVIGQWYTGKSSACALITPVYPRLPAADKTELVTLVASSSYLFTSPRHTIPFHAIPYHAIPYHTIPYHTIPYHTILYHTILYYIIPYHTIPYHTIPYHTIPYQPSSLLFKP
jgi:hypothetical protein